MFSDGSGPITQMNATLRCEDPEGGEGVSKAQVSVIVRAKDKADTIRSTLAALRRQTVEAEVIVVDSGSTDGTLSIAREWADTVIQIRPEEFTYGGALNIGAAAASCPVQAALSAHCVPPTDSWLADSLAKYRTSGVAGTNAALFTPTGDSIEGTYHQTLEDVERNPGWGFSNHASTWLSEAWRSEPFCEDLVACEDKEWSWRVLATGWTIAYAPELVVPSAHRRKAGLGALTERVARETEAMVGLGAAAPLTTRGAAAAWWSSFRRDRRHPRMLLRASPYRIAELTGAWLGSRRVELPVESRLDQILAGTGRPRRPWEYVPWA
jgi:rhamnosyltransferase